MLFELSIDLLYTLFGQWVAKLLGVKLGSEKYGQFGFSVLFFHKISMLSGHMLESRVWSPVGMEFQEQQFSSILVCKNVEYLFWKIYFLLKI